MLIRMAKQGSTLAGMMDAFSSTITQGLRHGVPLRVFVSDYVGMRFEPAGLTNDPEVKQASSVMDYVGRRLALDYLPYDLRVELSVLTAEERATKEAIDGVGDAVWTDLVGLSMSAPSWHDHAVADPSAWPEWGRVGQRTRSPETTIESARPLEAEARSFETGQHSSRGGNPAVRVRCPRSQPLCHPTQSNRGKRQ
ncbi:hypothetical protein AB0H30_01760 [Streptomyces pseudogriseolus]|uniref:TSCPD domain-containing protein n=1 Tax=Streptomyces pseudogriseolus TaxID=36817 RepID=UPI00347F93D2